MGTHLSALTSCTSRRTASITLTKLPHHGHGCASADWTSATRSTRRLVSSQSESIGSFHATRSHSYYAHWPEEEEEELNRQRFLDGGGGGGDERGSSFTGDGSVGREKGSSTTTSTSTSLQRDFDGEGYREDVDSIVDLIDLMHRDVLHLPPTPSETMPETMMTTMTTSTGDSRPNDSSSSSKRKLNREFSTRSVKTQSGKWDSSVDNVIADIFDKIYSAKRSS